MDGGDLALARTLLDEMAQELRSHWRGEENGFFQAMSRTEEYRDYIAQLILEHRELDALLTAADLSTKQDRDAVRVAVADLADHIRKEEDGLFPASLTALDGQDWNESMAAWQEAHPGSRLQTFGS